MTNLTHTNNGLNSVWPDIIAEKKSENSIELNLFVSDKLDYFNGHFPNAPILAGVVQLHWAIEYAKKAFNLQDCDVVNLEVLKFQVVIVPNLHLILTLTQKSNEKVVFTYESDRGQHASGRIVFGSSS